MKKKLWGIVALVIICGLTLVLAQFVPNKVVRSAICLIGGAIASTVQKHIAAK